MVKRVLPLLMNFDQRFAKGGEIVEGLRIIERVWREPQKYL